MISAMGTTLGSAQLRISNSSCQVLSTSSFSQTLSRVSDTVLLKDRSFWCHDSSRWMRMRSGRQLDNRYRRVQVAASSDSGEESVEALEAKLGIGRRRRSGGGSNLPRENPVPVRKSSGTTEPPQEAKPLDLLGFLRDSNEGVLFWLNKLSYGAIFVLIGAWILFRFVGPSLGFYELENPLLPPDQIFKGP